jgi:hypothetical protein
MIYMCDGCWVRHSAPAFNCASKLLSDLFIFRPFIRELPDGKFIFQINDRPLGAGNFKSFILPRIRCACALNNSQCPAGKLHNRDRGILRLNLRMA